jgi:CRISPR/Cas system-associated endonuclease Cas1
MNTYSIEIKETLSKVIKVESDTIKNALIIANKKYDNQEIVLDEGNLESLYIDVIGETSMEENLDFVNFVLSKAEEMISHLSIEELAKIGFGEYSQAIHEFNITNNGN